MNKLNLLASLAAAPALTPGTVLVANQNLGPQDIFDKIPGGHKIDKKILQDIILTKIENASVPGTSNRTKLLVFYQKINEGIKKDPSLLNSLFNIFKLKESNAFFKDPTTSFVDFVADQLIESAKIANEVTDLADLKKIIRDFIDKINSPNFLDNFGNSGKNKFIKEIDREIKDLANKHKISATKLNPIKEKIKKKYSKMLLTLSIDENNYFQIGEPYYLKEAAFDSAVSKTIQDELKSIANAQIISSGMQETLEKEFEELLKDNSNLQPNFSPKTLDYLRYYLKDREKETPSTYENKKDYFFKKLFGENKLNWSNKAKQFWQKWFGLRKDINISVEISKYESFQVNNDKADIEIGFKVIFNDVSALNSNSKNYKAEFNKPDENWFSKYLEKWINDNFKKINSKIIKEWEDEGYKISEDGTTLEENFWKFLKAKKILDIDDLIQKDQKLKDKISKDDFKLIVSKQEDRWIFKISINKNLGPTGDPVAEKYNHLIMDQISEVEFQTIIYGIKQNLLKTTPISTSPIKDEDLKRSEIYGGIYQDDLKEIINAYPDKIIPLKELNATGKLRSLFMTRYTTSEIDRFIQYIKDLSLNGIKYSFDNSNGKIGKIGYKIITNSNKDKILGFNLVIDNEKGATKEEVVIPENNLRIEEYQNQEDRFDKWLYNAKINAEHALVPGSPAPANKWEKLKKIIPDLDPNKKQDEGNKFYLNTFARIFELVDDSLEKHFEFKQFENVWKVIFTLNNGQKYEKIISLDALPEAEKDAFKNKTNNRLNEIKGYIDKIQDQNLKAKIEDIYQVKRAEIDNLLNNLQTKDDAEKISNKVINLVSEVTESISEDEKKILLNEVKKRYPNGVPEEVEEKIKRIIKDKKNKLLNKTRIEIENILDNGQDLYKDIKNIDIEKLLNINKTLTNFEKYGIIAIGGVLAFDSVAAGAVAYGISRKNKKLANTSKTKMKRAKSLIIFNLAISLLTAGGSVAMFILIFIIKGGL